MCSADGWDQSPWLRQRWRSRKLRAAVYKLGGFSEPNQCVAAFQALVELQSEDLNSTQPNLIFLRVFFFLDPCHQGALPLEHIYEINLCCAQNQTGGILYVRVSFVNKFQECPEFNKFGDKCWRNQGILLYMLVAHCEPWRYGTPQWVIFQNSEYSEMTFSTVWISKSNHFDTEVLKLT